MKTMELTSEEVVKVFAIYWGQKVMTAKTWDKTSETTFVLIFYGEDLRNDWLLNLYPLSKISDEDVIGVAKIMFGYDIITAKSDKKIINTQIEKYTLENSLVFQYLVSKGYAVPLFFGVGHPSNGKTAIELGIAIDKTL